MLMWWRCRRYVWATLRHKWFVLVGALGWGRSIRVEGISVWQALLHDLSKLSRAELPGYDRSFFGDKGDPEGFAIAWLHHQNHNSHHAEYWYTRADIGQVADAQGRLPMPIAAVREMVLDWHAASRAYTSSWDITAWLDRNLANKLAGMHVTSRAGVLQVLEALKYRQDATGHWHCCR